MLQLMHFLEMILYLQVKFQLSLSVLLLQEVVQGYEQDTYTSQILAELVVHPTARKHFSLSQGLLRYKGRIWIGNNTQLQHRIIDELHSSPMGGHSGIPVTYRRAKALFAWPSMKK